MVDASNSDVSLSGDKRGGWITFPFILGCLGGLMIAGGGWLNNIIVYLIQEYDMNSIDAAQVSNVINGSLNFIPVIAAIIADSFFGCYSVVFVSSLISLLGVILITLTSTLDFMRPKHCSITQTNTCNGPSKLQLAILYTSLTLASIGQGGIRFTLATMGANQVRKPHEQATFFNVFFVVFYIAMIITSTVIVYVEDNIGWDWGYGISAGANLIGLVLFLIGSKFYRHVVPQGSPFTSIARVIVATARNYRVESGEYCRADDAGTEKSTDSTTVMPTKNFKFLNRAALVTEDTINANGSIAKPWKLCTVQQVEDLKTLIRIFPLWSSSIFLGTPIGIMLSLLILQALTMDRHLGNHFKVPASSLAVFSLISIIVALALLDKIFWPAWHRIIGRPHTPLQRIGVGHVFTIISLVIAALVEIKRRACHVRSNDNNKVVPISVMWLVPQVAVIGLAEAFHFPGQVELYYKEFPNALKNMGTAMIALLVAVSYYISTAMIGLTRRLSDWLPDDINKGRLENVYWMLSVIGVINFGYFLIRTILYKYQNVDEENPENLSEMR